MCINTYSFMKEILSYKTENGSSKTLSSFFRITLTLKYKFEIPNQVFVPANNMLLTCYTLADDTIILQVCWWELERYSLLYMWNK